ncbi:hypothetical protein [Actinoplanes sichuanensis]|uniref:Uncharacterized protein n=1 Tax=Actinoplanes sichuanensis TaxID=512349 RepID=A0ABW4ANI8_9ACTN|nr:hypothetical protein [Actinoplanes sichuanensis]
MAVVTARSARELPGVRLSAANNRTIMLSEKQSHPGMSQSQFGVQASNHECAESFFFFFLRTLTIT